MSLTQSAGKRERVIGLGHRRSGEQIKTGSNCMSPTQRAGKGVRVIGFGFTSDWIKKVARAFQANHVV